MLFFCSGLKCVDFSESLIALRSVDLCQEAGRRAGPKGARLRHRGQAGCHRNMDRAEACVSQLITCRV